MIRFVDLTEAYWLDGGDPLCAFLDTVTNKFIVNLCEDHVFHDTQEILELPEIGERCAGLVPDGFFERSEPEHDIGCLSCPR